jgi:hypothetical protein
MNIQKTVTNLLAAYGDRDTSPEKLARLYLLTLAKLAQRSPIGEDALKIIRNRIIQETLNEAMTANVGHARKARTHHTRRSRKPAPPKESAKIEETSPVCEVA